VKSIAVCSGKGSPGATFAAVNLAYALHTAGRNVLLLDLDPNGGDVAGYLGLDPRKGLYPLSIMGRADYATEALLGEIEERAGIKCIAGFPNSTPMPPAALVEILDSAMQSEPLVIADLGRIDARSAEVARAVELVLIVIRPDLISTHGTQRATEVLLGAGVEKSRLRLLVSGLSLRRAADAGEIGQVVGIPLDGMIPLDRSGARRALQSQLPVLKGRAARAFIEVAASLLAQTSEDNALTEAAVA
jgi:MinD-like ATPase involved in chromosome partitioning or flagellar assembly